MAVQYTTNYNFPLGDDGGGSWGAILNGFMTDIDTMLFTAQIDVFDIMTHENEVLVHDGDVLMINAD